VNEETENKVLALLDVISVEVAASRVDIGRLDSKVASLNAQVTSGFERVERRLGHLETRVADVEIEARLFRKEFERRVAPLERGRKS
jgi:hypothetical protein